jgi:hypothetical protein
MRIIYTALAHTARRFAAVKICGLAALTILLSVAQSICGQTIPADAKWIMAQDAPGALPCGDLAAQNHHS